MEVLKVSATTDPERLAWAVAQAVRNAGGRKVALQAVGAAAAYRAVKAIAGARGFLAPHGIDLMAVPAFCEAEGRDGPIKGMRFLLCW